MTEKKVRSKKKRIIALIFSGIYVIVILPLIGIIISFIIDNNINIRYLLPPPYNFVFSIILLVNGFFWAIWANIELYRRGEGSPVPGSNTETRYLVFSGPYSYSRNPMVFGYIKIWFGLGFLFNSFFLTVGFSSAITIVLVIIIKVWEEKNLEKRFGNDYKEYKNKSSFIIPLKKFSIKES